MQISTPSMQDLLAAGVHFGHKVARSHPKMKPFIFGSRDGVDIIDLEKSHEKLQQANQAAYELAKSGGVMLLVGTKKQAKDIIENLAKEVKTPYLTAHWIGGLLTNFEEISKNFKKLLNLKEQQQKGELSHYTKKEQLLISRRLAKFTADAGGVANLEKIPEAIFITDAVSENTAIREALKMGVKIFGLCDSNADPNLFDWPIPANDDGIKSLKLICETVIKAYGKGKSEAHAKLLREEKKAQQREGETLDSAVADEAAALEEVVEKKVVEESERKPARVEE